ncbi:7-carboxy-7-deazaguanine synthase [Robiginitomaculum antarcticum]|uniref:7-carboxy-7-deazaguanine synthase n=1 Tax=Robiginitomaculum antarcticum TaxID=437507 RepID=UPI00037B8C2F
MSQNSTRIYSVKETYLTVQGEGAQTGRPAVFLRFAGCNLWSGREKDRATAVCKFCDTQFVGTDGPGGGQFKTPDALAEHVMSFWPKTPGGEPWVVCTGGEPLLQLGAPLIAALHKVGLKIAVESNGTIAAPEGIDWLTVSPKASAPLVQKSGDELKLVFPQVENHPEDFTDLDFKNFYLQPRDDSLTDSSKNAAHAQAAFEYCLRHPQWKLSVQTHKFIGVP